MHKKHNYNHVKIYLIEEKKFSTKKISKKNFFCLEPCKKILDKNKVNKYDFFQTKEIEKKKKTIFLQEND